MVDCEGFVPQNEGDTVAKCVSHKALKVTYVRQVDFRLKVGESAVWWGLSRCAKRTAVEAASHGSV